VYDNPSQYWSGDSLSLSPGSYTISAQGNCDLQDSESISDFLVENISKRNPTAFISGYKGEIIACDGYSIVEYLGGNDRRQWTWKSKDISLQEDNKFKKFYNVNMTTNIESIINDVTQDAPASALFNSSGSGTVDAEYSVNGEEGTFHTFTDKGWVKPDHRKSKSIQIKVKSVADVNKAELSSISLTYKRLPNTSGNY